MNSQNQNTEFPKLILIDDDQSYCSIMRYAARQQGVELETFNSLMELYAHCTEYGPLGYYKRYEAVMVDFDLGSITGVEIAERLSTLFGDIPIVLVSHTQRTDANSQWPINIVKFLNKADGHASVLSETLKISKPQVSREKTPSAFPCEFGFSNFGGTE